MKENFGKNFFGPKKIKQKFVSPKKIRPKFVLPKFLFAKKYFSPKFYKITKKYWSKNEKNQLISAKQHNFIITRNGFDIIVN